MGRDRDVDIYVKPDKGNPGHYLFSMDEVGIGSTNELTFDKGADGMWKWESYKIIFRLHNQEGANLKFSKDMTKVLWAEPTSATNPPNPACPTSQQMGTIFYVDKPSDIQDQQLKVTNTDPARQRFVFGFNFLPATENDGPSANYVLYDPIGNNQNGGYPRSYAMLEPATIGGTVIGAVVGAFAAPFLNPEPTMITYVWGALIGAIVGYAVGLFLGKPSGGSVRSAPHA